MKIHYTRLFIFFFVVFLSLMGKNRLLAQASMHIPDKVYLHLDRNLYAQGDTVWIKGYVMQRGTNLPSDKSYAIHVQMLNEEGQQVGDYKLLTVDGEAVGQIELFSLMKPGFYQLVAHTGYMKNFDQRFFFKTTIEVREKKGQRSITTTFDKENYDYGDTALVTFFVTDEYHNSVEGARFNYEYVQGEKVLKKEGVHCDEEGSMTVKVPILDDKNSCGESNIVVNYLAYDGAHQRKTKTLSIPIKAQVSEVSFFPEGGDLIDGILSKVAFKASDVRGYPVAVQGELLKDGLVVCECRSIHDGMGYFGFKPEAGASYTFRITSPEGVERLFDLPKIKKQGFVLAYKKQDEELVSLTVAHNYSLAQKCQLWISYCDSLLSVSDVLVDSVAYIPVSKEELPLGIVTFTLSDELGEPVAERLVYVAQEYPTITLSTDKPMYRKSEQVVLAMAIDEPIISSLSYAIVDSSLGLSPKVSTSSIKAYAELESELQGDILNANQYIGIDRSTAVKRDLLLMTHGWRRFECLDNNEYLSALQLRDYNQVNGKVSRMGKPYAKSEIIVFDLRNTRSFLTLKTDERACFSFTPEYKTRRYKNFMVVANAKRRNFKLSVKLENTDTIGFATVVRDYSPQLLMPTKVALERPSKTPFKLYDTYQLQELEVTAKVQEWDMEKYLNMAQDVKYGVELEAFQSFELLLRQVSNRLRFETDSTGWGRSYMLSDRAIVSTSKIDRKDIFNYETNKSVLDAELRRYYYESNPPSAMVYLNDKPVGYELSNLDFLKKEDIAAVAVIDGAKAYDRFGIEAYYGAIMVYTYAKDIMKKRELELNKVQFGDFVKARRFPAKTYDPKNPIEMIEEDYRVTLHWSPFIRTDIDGKAQTTFYTSEVPGKKYIIVQGFDDEGNLYYQTSSFMVVGDHVRIE